MPTASQFSTKEYVSSAALNAATANANSAAALAVLGICTAGLMNPSSATHSFSGTVLTATFSSPFAIVTASGQVAYAHGATNGQDTQTYTSDASSLEPGSGSVEVYWYLTYLQIQQSPYTVVGPPQGHPSWNPSFVPYTAYANLVDSFSLNVGTSVPAGSLEFCRASLSSSGALSSVDFSHQVWAAAGVGLPAGTYPSGFVTVDGNGRLTGFTQTPVGSALYLTPGVFTFTVPSNVFYATSEVWGGGAGGGGATSGSQGTGGEGGAYGRKSGAVIPGNTYTVTVGGPGFGGGVGGNGGGGGNSGFQGPGFNVVCTTSSGGIGNGSFANAGSTVTGADLGLLGGSGDAQGSGIGGRGGNSPRGGSGGSTANGAAGNAGRGIGAGGGGGGGAAGPVTGAAGQAGAVFISWGG